MENNIQADLTKDLLKEDITNPLGGDYNVAQVDQNLTVDEMFQETLIPSLAREVCSTVRLNGPSGAIFNIKKKGTDDFQLVRKDLIEEPSTIKKTGITREAVQDLKSQFSLDAKIIIGSLFRGLSNDIENNALLALLQTEAEDVGPLVLSQVTNAEMNLFEITQKVHEIVLELNQEVARTYEAFCILPSTPLAGIMGLSKYANANSEEENGYFITQISKTKFYLNPDSTDTYAYVGLKDSKNMSKSSLVFAPYINEILDVIDPDTGEVCYFLVNRFAVGTSALHSTGNELIKKFEIQ